MEISKGWIKKIKVVVFIALVLSTSIIRAQSSTTEIWSGIQIEKKLSNGFSLLINPEYRGSNKYSNNELFLETGLEFKANKFLFFSSKYRFASQTVGNSELELGHRIAFDVKGKLDINRFDMKLRTRFTNYSDFDSDNFISNPYIRYKLSVKYNIKNSKITPFTAMEIYHELDDNEFNKFRYSAGAVYKISKRSRISLEYNLLEHIKKSYFKNIVSVQYKYKF
ncbi:MAG: DUF2490 domain-containing protein [Salinivirgaceae bacterium]|jgi:hypothetical protein|nr:DUF2490 domain-containing protein [Salinivirgaceae bacterium]